MRSLRRPAPLPLHWLTTERPVAAPAATVVGGAVVGRPVQLRFHGLLDEVAEKFLALPHHRLVVLGEPGAGKTVLATLLTLDLLARRQPDDAVPVLLSVSSWNPTTEHLHAWIARRLDEDCPAALGNAAAYGPAAAQQLVLAGCVLPILDGLDELPAALRVTAVDNLDQAHAGRPLVLTCRSQEYQEAVTTSGQLLAAAAVVELQPVAVVDVISFVQAAIASTDTRWEQAFSELRAHPTGALALALSSPLMAALARAIYSAPTRDLAWWELALAVPRRAIGLMVALVIGLLGWVLGQLVGGLWVGLVSGLMGSLWVGLVAWSVAERLQRRNDDDSEEGLES